MGVRGLETYMEKCCPDACYKVYINDLIDTFRRQTGRQPVIVVDGSCCIRELYGALEWVHGGQLKEFRNKLQCFVKAFESLGVKLVIFFDGATVGAKRPVWIRRRLTSLQKVYELLDSLNRWKNLSLVDQRLFQLPPGLATRYAFKEFCNLEVFTSIQECDYEIAEYARNNGSFAILGQDTDYIIYEGAQYYLSMKNLNLSTMTTLNYNRWALARNLGIEPDKLPILASLIGNDIVPFDDLQPFHTDVCRRVRRHNTNSRIPFHILFREVARYLQTLPRIPDVFRKLPAIANVVFKDGRRAEQLGASIRSYCIEQRPHQQTEEPRDHWSKVMTMARTKHVHCENPPQVWAILDGLLYECSTAIEDFRETDLPAAALALRPLRQRIYGLLLHEKPRNLERIVVTEWCMHGEHSLQQPALVEPVDLQGIPHPGLLTLWNKGSEDLRWKVFCAAVSPKLDPKLLRELPPHLVIPAAALTYLCQELQGTVLETWEVECLIIQAVILEEYDIELLSQLKVPHVYTRAVRISTLFMRTVFIMLLLLASCGYPISCAEALPYKYFDGKLFGCVYHKTKLGTKYEDQCSHKTQLMDWYQKVQQIVCGHLHN